jgi:hypothetical protein
MSVSQLKQALGGGPKRVHTIKLASFVPMSMTDNDSAEPSLAGPAISRGSAPFATRSSEERQGSGGRKNGEREGRAGEQSGERSDLSVTKVAKTLSFFVRVYRVP